MTTPLQQAAQSVIDRWDSPKWKDEPPTAVVIGALRKAIADEIAQAVEPKLPELFGEIEWLGNEVRVHVFQRRADQTPLNVHSSTHSAPPPAGDLASLICRADASVTALNSRITETFYCSLDQDAARVLSDCVDMLEADGVLIGEGTKAQQVAVPDGWVLVPIEPTDAMCEAAWDGEGVDYVGEHKRIHRADLAYIRMLAAAQGAKK